MTVLDLFIASDGTLAQLAEELRALLSLDLAFVTGPASPFHDGRDAYVAGKVALFRHEFVTEHEDFDFERHQVCCRPETREHADSAFAVLKSCGKNALLLTGDELEELLAKFDPASLR